MYYVFLEKHKQATAISSIIKSGNFYDILAKLRALKYKDLLYL